MSKIQDFSWQENQDAKHWDILKYIGLHSSSENFENVFERLLLTLFSSYWFPPRAMKTFKNDSPA